MANGDLEARLAGMSLENLTTLLKGTAQSEELRAAAIYLAMQLEESRASQRALEEQLQFHPRYTHVEGLAANAEGSTVRVYNGDFLKSRLLEVADNYLRHKTGFTIIAGDIAGLHYTNIAEGWSAGDAKLDEAARIFSQFARRPGDRLAVPGFDEFFLVLANHPDIDTIIDRIHQKAGEWNAKRRGTPLLLGYGHLTEKFVDDCSLKTIGRASPETPEEHAPLKSGIITQMVDELNRQMTDYKQRIVYPEHPYFGIRNHLK